MPTISSGPIMPIDVDFPAWSAMEALSIHEIACLCIGTTPTKQKNCVFAPPRIPGDLLDSDEKVEADQEYWRIVRLLKRAREEKVVTHTHTGRIKPTAAVAFLEEVARQSRDDWSEHCHFARAVKSLLPRMDEVEELASKIKGLELDLANLNARVTYTTPMLELVGKVIDEFYAGKNGFPKQETVFDFLRGQKIEGRGLSHKKMESIWAVAAHPDQEKGGLKPLKNKS